MITIIPAIDIIDGQCVRLTQGDYSTKKIYNSNPTDVAKQFEDQGFKRLHLVDLDGAKNKNIVNLHILESIAKNTNLEIDFGGGIKSTTDLKNTINAGASYATIGSLAATNKELVLEWISVFLPEKFIIGIDTLNEKIRIKGWLEEAKISVSELMNFYKKAGVKIFMLTDIAKDGKLEGLNLSYYKKIKMMFPGTEIIASGGVSSIHDIDALNAMKIESVVVGKAFYENKIEINELQKYL